MRVEAFDNASGKWPAMVASLLVKLSAELLKWQNPGEACGALLQTGVSRTRAVAKSFVAMWRGAMSVP
jgi:hypothetical protein